MISFIRRNSEKKAFQISLFLGLFLPVVAFLFWKCRYGIGNIDETFYLTIPYRLLQGDALFVHEWHLSQMAGMLTMPLMSVLAHLQNGTDGIVLAMRYITTFVHCLIAMGVFFRLRAFHYIGAICAALCFALYIPFGIMALSYNSMGILFLTLSCMLLLPCQKLQRTQLICAGVAYAAACLCCPHLVVVFFAAVAVMAILMIIRRKHLGSPFLPFAGSLFPKPLYFSLGAAASAFVFTVFVFSRASLQQIIRASAFILNDPEHPSVSLAYKAFRYVYAIVAATDVSLILYAVLLVLFAVCALDRRRKHHRHGYFAAVCICTLALMLDLYFEYRYLNAVMWAVNIPAVFILLLSDKRESPLLFSAFWVPGILYSICIHLSSNQEFLAISSAATVSVIGSVMMLAVFLRELALEQHHPKTTGVLTGLVILILATQLLTEAELRYRNVFWEDGIDQQTILLENGIQAGLYASQESADAYASTMSALDALEQYPGKKALFLSRNTGLYLAGQYEIAGYSAWLSGVNEHSLMRLEAYYQLNPDKLPDVAYAEAANKDIALAFADKFDYQIHESAQHVILTR